MSAEEHESFLDNLPFDEAGNLLTTQFMTDYEIQDSDQVSIVLGAYLDLDFFTFNHPLPSCRDFIFFRVTCEDQIIHSRIIL